MEFLYDIKKGEGIKEQSLLRTWCYTIAVKRFLFGQFLSFCFCLCSYFFGLFCCAEPSTSLLVHLCPRRYTIYSHKEQLFRFDFPKKMVDVGKNGSENLLLRKSKMSILVVGVRT